MLSWEECWHRQVSYSDKNIILSRRACVWGEVGGRVVRRSLPGEDGGASSAGGDDESEGFVPGAC